LSLVTGSAAVMATSGVGSAALCPCATNESRVAVTARGCRASLGLDGRGRPSPHEHLVGGASGLLGCGLFSGLCRVPGCAFFGSEVLAEVIQKGVAIGIGYDGAQAFHFFKFAGPLLAGQALLGDAACVVTLGAGGLNFSLCGSGRKRLAWGAGRLRARQNACQNDGCEQKECCKKIRWNTQDSPHTHGFWSRSELPPTGAKRF